MLLMIIDELLMIKIEAQSNVCHGSVTVSLSKLLCALVYVADKLVLHTTNKQLLFR